MAEQQQKPTKLQSSTGAPEVATSHPAAAASAAAAAAGAGVGAGLMASKPEEVPGAKPPTMATRMVESTAGALQSFEPLSNFNQHVNTWAMYSQDPTRKIETHHYVSRLSEEVLQSVVFDSPNANARIIGVEYIISDNLFNLLPEDEKKLWHSHAYEIREGLWVNPGVPEMMQQAEAKRLINSYGKFWNLWQFDRGDKLPLGPPALMVSPQDHPLGRIPKDMVDVRDKHLRISTAEKREARGWVEDMAKEKESEEGIKATGADWWACSGEGWITLMKPHPIPGAMGTTAGGGGEAMEKGTAA